MTAFRRVLRVLTHLLAAWVAALLLASAAWGDAALRTDLDCYQQARQVTVSGSGFAPGATYTFMREGHTLGTGTVAGDGTVTGTFSSGRLTSRVAERAVTITVTDGTNTASARFRVTRFLATFLPRHAGPLDIVRFSVFGFGFGAQVYVHYLRPSGTVARTVNLGGARGPCGKIPRAAPRRLFPFRPVRGAWRLQFDTQAAYARGAVPRLVIPLLVTR